MGGTYFVGKHVKRFLSANTTTMFETHFMFRVSVGFRERERIMYQEDVLQETMDF